MSAEGFQHGPADSWVLDAGGALDSGTERRREKSTMASATAASPAASTMTNNAKIIGNAYWASGSRYVKEGSVPGGVLFGIDARTGSNVEPPNGALNVEIAGFEVMGFAETGIRAWLGGHVHHNLLHDNFMTGTGGGFQNAVGWSPQAIIEAMMKIHQYAMLCAPIMSQNAAIEDVEEPQRTVHRSRREMGPVFDSHDAGERFLVEAAPDLHDVPAAQIHRDRLAALRLG